MDPFFLVNTHHTMDGMGFLEVNPTRKNESPLFWMIRIPEPKKKYTSIFQCGCWLNPKGWWWWCIGTPYPLSIQHPLEDLGSLWWKPIFLMAFGLLVGWHVLRFFWAVGACLASRPWGYWNQKSPSFDDSDVERGGFEPRGGAFRRHFRFVTL